MAKSEEPTAEQKRHWTAVARFGCLAGLCGAPAQIAHLTHGERLRELGFHKGKGKKFRWMHWLVGGLCERHHWLFDNRPESFEPMYGDAVDLLLIVQRRTGIDVFARARALMRPSLPVRVAP